LIEQGGEQGGATSTSKRVPRRRHRQGMRKEEVRTKKLKTFLLKENTVEKNWRGERSRTPARRGENELQRKDISAGPLKAPWKEKIKKST